MSNTGMNRRQFLQTSGLAAAGVAVIASGTVLMASDGAWALELGAVSADEGMALLKMTRQLYPHDTLADMYYAGVVEALDGEAKGNAELAGMIKEGVARLDGAMGVKFAELSEGNQLEVLKSMEDSAFFQKVRGTTVVALYNNPLVWRHFGYEGPSAEFGGYLERGFDDLTWAGEPSEDASPKAG
ncbi:MAG: gluconate 2-dehydrogenase subunit 3 family protein [Rhodospirillales bacterium]|nr:gluconate 2-dehydrogenase subunit 3 family protein [Rhodospirillales bacterium]